MLKHSLRGCVDWKSEGLSITTTTSDEATKLYDCALSQLCGWYDEPNYGGFANTLSDMTKADPNFVLGQSLAIGLELGGTKQTVGEDVKKRVIDLVDMVNKNKERYEPREVKHVEALKHLVKGDIRGTVRVWEEILSQYPTDIHAIRMCHDLYFTHGLQNQMRDSIARVLPHWTGRSLPLEGYLHGMYAFGLEETHFYSKAESEANLALEMNACDGWAAHAMSHIHETRGLTQTGIKFLKDTEKDWIRCNWISCHVFWHLSLQYIQTQEYEKALDIFDAQIITRAQKSGRIGNIVDASSLLFRLGLTQTDTDLVTDNRWKGVYGLVEPHLKTNYKLGFWDIHCLLASLGAKQSDSVEQIVQKIGAYESDEQWLKTTRAIVDGIVEYSRENYQKCVELLLDVKYLTQCLGGSNAQRDVINQILISAALKSPLDCHKKLAINLMNEYQSFRQIPDLNQILTKK